MTMATQLSSVVPGPSPMRGLEGSDLTLCLFCYKKCPKTDEDLGRFVNLVGIWLGRQISSRCLEGEDGRCCGECRILVEGVCAAVEKWKEMEDNVRGKMGKLKRRILRSNRGPEIWQEKRRRIEEGEGMWRKEFREELLQERGGGGRGVKMEVNQELPEWVLEYFVGWIVTLAAVTVLALEEPPGPFERGCGCVQMEGETRTSGRSFGGVRGSLGGMGEDAKGILDQLRKELRQAVDVNSTAFLEELVGMPIYSQESQVGDGEDGLGDEGQVPGDVGKVSEVLEVNLEENGAKEPLEGTAVKPAVETQEPIPNDLEEVSGVAEVNLDERRETEQPEEPSKTPPMEPPTILSLPSGVDEGSGLPGIAVNPDISGAEEPRKNSVGSIVETQEEMPRDIQEDSVIPEANTNARMNTEPPQEPAMPPPFSMEAPISSSQCSYSCKFCTKVFSSETTLRQHIRCHHTPSRSFLLQNYCSYCKISFPNNVLLRKHNLYSESHKLLKNDMLKKKAKLSKSSSSQQESLSSQSESTSQCSQEDASFSESQQISNPPPPQESQSAKENDAHELLTPTPSTSQVPPETNPVQVKQENVEHVDIDIEESSKDSDSEPDIVFIEEIEAQPKTPIPSPNPGPSKSPPASKKKKTKDVPYFPCGFDGCDAKFSSKEKYKLHRKYHTQGKFKCQFCKDVKSTLVKLAQHEQRRHVKKKDNQEKKCNDILCSRCNARFDKVARYYAHFADAHVIQLKQKKKRPRINCKKCGVQIYKQDWEAHRRQAHGKSNGKKKNEKGLRCLDCPMRFHGQLNFQEHLIRVHNLYLCQECGKTFENKYSLDLHMTLKKAVKGKK